MKSVPEPVISVVVSTNNRAHLLHKCLISLINQSIDPQLYEIIVVDNNSTDHTKKLVEVMASNYSTHSFRYYIEKYPGIRSARNFGVTKAKGGYIGFVDDDAQADPNWLNNSMVIIDKYAPAIFGGPISPQYEKPPPKWFKPSYELRTHGNKQQFLFPPKFLSGSNIFVNKKVFNMLNGFDTTIDRQGHIQRFGEETDFQASAHKHKLSVLYSPAVQVINHYTPATKTTLYHAAKTHFTHGYYRSLHEKPLWWKHSIKAVLAFLSIVSKLIYIPLRNKSKYPYWQNYAKEKISPEFFWFGRFSTLVPFNQNSH